MSLSLILEDGRRVVTDREWPEPTRFDAGLGEVGRWTGAADLRSTLAVTSRGEWVVVPWPLEGRAAYEVTAAAAAGWFVACGLEREMPDELRAAVR